MAFEDELRAALVARAARLLGAATKCLGEANDSLTQARFFEPVRAAKADLDAAEALEAGIMNRCGVSWDTMASLYDQTRQALHRRLGARADREMDAAISSETSNLRDVQEYFLMLSAQIDKLREKYSQDPSEFYSQIAQDLSEARRYRRWRWWTWWTFYRSQQANPKRHRVVYRVDDALWVIVDDAKNLSFRRVAP